MNPSVVSAPPPLGQSEAHVWIAKAPSVPLRLDGRHVLDAAERDRASKLSSPGAALSFERGRAWTRSVLAGYLGAHPADLLLHVGSHGKPRLDGAHEGLVEFNASHAGDLVAVVVGRSPVGIDIERVRELSNFAGMVDRVLAAPERSGLEAQPQSARLAAFFECWTRKEAFLKGVGTGIRSRLVRVVTRPDPTGGEEEVVWEDDSSVALLWRLRGLVTPAGYVGAVAVHPGTTIRILS